MKSKQVSLRIGCLSPEMEVVLCEVVEDPHSCHGSLVHILTTLTLVLFIEIRRRVGVKEGLESVLDQPGLFSIPEQRREEEIIHMRGGDDTYERTRERD